MKLSEVQKDDIIKIRAYTDDEEVELKAVYADISDEMKTKIGEVAKNTNFVPIEMVHDPKKDNTVVLFADVKCSLEALVYHEDKLYKFDEVIVPRANINDKDTIQLIVGNTPGVRYNRRNAFRVTVGVQGEMVVDDKIFNATVRDISSTGVGIIVTSDVKVEVGTDVRIQFSDSTYGFDLLARIVREQPVSENYKIIGLVIYPSKREMVDKYVAQKQLDMQINSTKKEEQKENIDLKE